MSFCHNTFAAVLFVCFLGEGGGKVIRTLARKQMKCGIKIPCGVNISIVHNSKVVIKREIAFE
jgi:hypothetical protein